MNTGRCEVFIHDGAHYGMHGRVIERHTHTEIPFLEVRPRRADGELYRTRVVLVPENYCAAFDIAALCAAEIELSERRYGPDSKGARRIKRLIAVVHGA